MGFPAGYTEVLLPKLLLHFLSLFTLLRRVLLSLLRTFGLPSFLDPDSDSDSDSPLPDPATLCPSSSSSVSATLIRDMLPVSTFSDLTLDDPSACACACAVCLCEFEADHEVRRMRNCRHVFHKGCVDRWIDHDRKTCPLCRTPFVPEELQEDFNDKLWAASGIPDFYSDYAPITSL